MKMDCIDKDIKTILSDGYYRIPRFQRPYSWDRTNLEEFWNDTIVDAESDYFIGSMVVFESKDAYGVVDGQQRLTTITMLLCALRDAFEAEGLENLAAGTHHLIERPDISNQMYFVLQPETSYPFFQEFVQKRGKPSVAPEIGPEEKLIKQAYDFLQTNVEEIVQGIRNQPNLSETKKKEKVQSSLMAIREKLLKLKAIFTSLDDEDDAYVIFETLNTRGKDLTVSDLVKNHLTRLTKPSNKGVDLAKDKWNKLAEIFEKSQADISITTFLHHYWLSRYDYITEKKLFKAIRKTITKVNAEQFLNTILEEGTLYREIHEPSTRKWAKEEFDVRDSLNALVLFRVKQQLPIVLAVMRQYQHGKLKLSHVRDILKAIENFHFSFTAITSQRSSGGISFMYASAARNLEDAASLQEKIVVLNALKAKLKQKRPPEAEFLARFMEIRYSTIFTKQKNLVRYLLKKIYEFHCTGIQIDAEKMTIEHLEPENPIALSGLTDEDVASIGNLIFVDEKLNNRLDNKAFADKQQILKNAEIWVDQDVLLAVDWKQGEIIARAAKLGVLAYQKIWKL